MTDFDIQVILDCRCVRRMSSKLQAGVDYCARLCWRRVARKINYPAR